MDRDTRIWATVLSFVLLLMLVIVTHQKYQDGLFKIAQLETELVVREELLEREIKELKEVQKILLEENQELKEKLKRYETLSGYIEERLKASNKGIEDELVDEIITVFWDQINTYGFEPEKCIAWIEQESNFKITAVSYKGAVGLTQIMPSTGQEIVFKMGFKYEGYKTLSDPITNLKMGFYHLKWGMENSVNEHQGFSMYFWGYGNVKKKGLVETNYSKSIFEKAEQLRRV